MECKETRELCKVLSKQGALTYPLVGSAFQPQGWPDRYIAYYGPLGRFSGFVEFKAPKGVLRAPQREVITELRKRGATVLIARFNEDFSRLYVEGWSRDYVKFNEFLAVICDASLMAATSIAGASLMAATSIHKH